MAGMYENGWNRLNLLQWVDAAERAGKAWKMLTFAGMVGKGWKWPKMGGKGLNDWK